MRAYQLLLSTLPLFTACSWQDYLAIEVRAEIEEACVVDLPAEFESGGGLSITGAVTRDQLGLDQFDTEGTELALLGVGVGAVDGIDDFSFVDALEVRIGSTDPGSALPMLTVIDLVRGDAIAGDELFNELDDAIDVQPYLTDGAIALEIEFSGELPAQPWAVAVAACFRAQVAYRKPLIPE